MEAKWRSTHRHGAKITRWKDNIDTNINFDVNVLIVN